MTDLERRYDLALDQIEQAKTPRDEQLATIFMWEFYGPVKTLWAKQAQEHQ